jgi:hypothetical protein
MDVTNLEVSVEGGVSPYAPFNILPLNTPFQLRVTFGGTGMTWNNMKARGLYFEVRFYAEGIGGPPWDANYGPVSGNLGTDPQTKTISIPAGLPNQGLYRFGAVVSFPPDPSTPGDPGWPGYVGYYDGLIVQVSPQA